MKFKPMAIIGIFSLLMCGFLSAVNDDGMSVFGDSESISSSDIFKGEVFDSVTKKPVKKAKIEFKNINLGVGYYTAETDSSGKFEIKGYIKNIIYRVAVSADGYVNFSSTASMDSDKMKIFLAPECRISGSVSDSAGKKIEGVDVRIASSYGYGEADEYDDYSVSSSGTRTKPVETTNSGAYSFVKLPAGSYNVTFSKAGYISETVQVRNVKHGEYFDLNMVLFRPSTITGKINISELNVPAVNVEIYAEGKAVHSAVTFDDGTYLLSDMKPGVYSVRTNHSGFFEKKIDKLNLKEGEEIKNIDFTVVPKKAEVDISSYRYVFSPGTTVAFEMRTFRIETASVSIYKVPVSFFTKGIHDPQSIDVKANGFEIHSSWKESIREFSPFEWRYQTLEITKPLPTGGYCIEVKGENGVMSRKFFTVTSVGVVAKRSPSSLFVYASSLVSNSPVKGTEVYVYKRKKTDENYYDINRIEKLPADFVTKAVTDEKGICQIKMQSNESMIILAVAPDRSFAFCESSSASQSQSEMNKFYIYTDRPVYRADDTVFYKIIAKKRSEVMTPIAGKQFAYRIINTNNNKIIEEGTISLDEWGTFNSKIKIPESAGLGRFELRVGDSLENLFARGFFYVEQYRKPEYKVEVLPSKEFFLNGESAEFKVDAKYFFGAPLKNAVVRYRFYETRDDFSAGDDRYTQSTVYDKLRLEGEKNLDDNGIAVLRIDTGKLPFDRKITLEATVTDASNISITSSGNVRIGRGEFYIKISPEKSFYNSSENKKILIETFSQSGKPVSADVEINLFRYIWKPYHRVYVHEGKAFFTKKISTDSKGKAELIIPAAKDSSGEFDIMGIAKDRFGNEIKASKVILIYSASSDTKSKFGNLELEVDKKKLDKPEEITILLKSRFTDANVCLTVEGRDVYASRIVKMNSNVIAVKLPVKDNYAPNFFVTATMQRGRALYTAREQVTLPEKDTSMKIVLTSDKEKYSPGEKAKIKIKAVDVNGKPVKADLSLAAVDESIFSIRYDHTPEINGFFYSKISNWVSTTYSYPINLYAGAGKDGKTKVRSRFEDTAFWKADIKTDASGEASVVIDLPDNLTTWRLTARGHDKSGMAGETRQKFLVSQDLVSRIGKPRFLIEGDVIDLLGIVTSNTPRGLSSVGLKFSADGSELKTDNLSKVSLPGFGTHSVSYKYNVPDKEAVELRFDSYADKEASDAVKYSLPVEKRGSRYRLFGIAETGKKTELKFLKNSSDFEFVPERAVVTFNPSPVFQMLNACNYLVEYPYGCIEQTINRFIPLLAVHTLINEKGAGHLIEDKYKKNLNAFVLEGISRVQSMQNDDGSWGWFAGDRGNEFLTCYALSSLKRAEQMGFKISKQTVDSGLAAVYRMMNAKNNKGYVSGYAELANLLYVYSLYGKWNHELYAELSKRKPVSYESAFVINALTVKNIERDKQFKSKNIDVADEIDKAKKALLDSASKDEYGIVWKSSYNPWSWQGNDSEMTAHALSALCRLKGNDDLKAQIVLSLSKRANGGIWVSTKGTGNVILSLCDYFDGVKDIGAEASEIKVLINGKNQVNIKYDPADKSAVSDRLTRYVKLSGEKGPVSFESSSAGGKGSTVSVTVEGTLKFNPKGFTSIFKSNERSLSALNNGIDISRTFYKLKRIFDLNGAEYLIPEMIKPENGIKSGDEIMVKVRFSSKENLDYVALEDFLPSGFEVSRVDAYGGINQYSRAERWDNRMVFFFSELKAKQVYELAYTVRAELSGKFMVRPSIAGCMYEPSVQGWSSPAEIEVKKK